MKNHMSSNCDGHRRTSFWKIAGGAVALAIITGLVLNAHDIKRYIRIVSM